MKKRPATPTHFFAQLANWEHQRLRPDLQSPRLRPEPRHLGPKEAGAPGPEVADWSAEPLALPHPSADGPYLAGEVEPDEWPSAEAELVEPEPLVEAEPQAQDHAPPLLLPAPAPLLSDYEEVLFAKIKAQHEQAQPQLPVDEQAELEQSVDELVRQVKAEFFGRRID
jgi:hypothetical protein